MARRRAKGRPRPSPQKCTAPGPFRWTCRSELAAQRLAAGDRNDDAIASEAGITRSGLARWKLRPEFAARVASHVEAARAAILARGIADRVERVASLDDRWRRLRRVVEARAADPAFAATPGWDTGLLVRKVKGVGRGADFRIVDLFEVDGTLLREMREHEVQAARELGQWAGAGAAGDDEHPPDARDSVEGKLARLASGGGAPGVPGLPDPGGAGGA